MQTFLTKWAIHFAEAIVALLIVMMIMRIAKRYRAQSAGLRESDHQSTLRHCANEVMIQEALTKRQTPPKATPANKDSDIAETDQQQTRSLATKPEQAGSKKILDNYIDDFFG